MGTGGSWLGESVERSTIRKESEVYEEDGKIIQLDQRSVRSSWWRDCLLAWRMGCIA